MKRTHPLAKSLLLIVFMSLATAAVAQKSAGTLRMPLRESPSSAPEVVSIFELWANIGREFEQLPRQARERHDYDFAGIERDSGGAVRRPQLQVWPAGARRGARSADILNVPIANKP